MNKHTLEKLKNNPHYKISEKQLKADDEEDQVRQPMADIGTVRTFGIAPKVSPDFEKHPTKSKTVTHRKR